VSVVEKLFEPARIGGLDLANRIVMAPMTRYFSPGGIPGEDVAQYYGRRAAHDVGLIVTEGTYIAHPSARDANPSIPLFGGEESLAGWKRVVDEVHAEGGKIVPQLWHVGLVAQPEPGAERGVPAPNQRGPSGLVGSLNMAPYEGGQALSEQEIIEVIDSFAKAAADAKRLGFDGVELHGAHGYLFDQFFWPATNRREDNWGGDLSARTRFAREVIAAIRRETGPGFPLIFRISQWKQYDFAARIADTPQELETWLAPLVDAGADVIHCSQRRFWENEPFEGAEMNLAGWVKKVTGLPTITVGSVGLAGDFLEGGTFHRSGSSAVPLDQLAERLDRGEFDLVAVGRALLQDPEWATKVREGRSQDLQAYDPSSLERLY